MRTLPVSGDGRVRVSGVRAAAKRSAGLSGRGLVLFVVVWWCLLAVQGLAGDWAFDFRQFWQGGNDVLNGISPYPDPAVVAKAGLHLDPEAVQRVFRFPYPAGAAVALAPFALLGFHAAAVVWSALMIVSLLGALRALEVRDWRVTAAVVTSAPVLTSVLLGTFTPLLVLLVALTWRWRDRKWLAGGSLALALALKLFLWPLVIWLAATRRFAAAFIAAGLAAVATLAAWAAIGFQGLADYPDLVRRLTEVVEGQGFSLVALGLEGGLPRGVAEVLPWPVGLSLLVYVVLAQRGVEERTTFSVAIVASIALTPIVWLHYFALLVVPLALSRPRLSWAWALMWVFWLVPAQGSQGDVWRILLVMALVCAVLVQALRGSGRRAVT